ncbi:GyrI-like domain-containing protein [Ureibacillus sinduriensis]|uniref:Transcriptional regulator n=2 Tax=Ureibacillus sinduriensis TaxID=561440 RepID=A0A0A3HRA3_9BACL|nr:effector binding domain-containing protein [Ureibacillus sinduriensis]KGR74924.1 transcriptional regulator [Ureibacillus sinduriensis BLB-1 = JCM 15800]
MKLTIINSTRTNNFSDDLMLEKITDLWKSASHSLVGDENTKYGIYHNYESDYKGDYSLSIGIECDGEEPTLVIPQNEKYVIFNVEPGDEQGVFNTWTDIWAQEEEGTLKRAYTYDFEKYDPKGEIAIYIAIKQ